MAFPPLVGSTIYGASISLPAAVERKPFTGGAENLAVSLGRAH